MYMPAFFELNLEFFQNCIKEIAHYEVIKCLQALNTAVVLLDVYYLRHIHYTLYLKTKLKRMH